MKKFFLSFFVIIASTAYALNQYFGGGGSGAAATLPPTQQQNPSSPTVSFSPPSLPVVPSTPAPTVRKPKPKTSPAPTPAPTPAPKPKGRYADGTYTGNAADAYYGIVKVQAVIQSGRLASVEFLEYPNDRETSRYISGQAMPVLKSEAIQAQSANVDIVSGATDTSMAFQQSLGNALAQAKN